MKTILITGINGFLGSNLAKLFKSEYRIIGLEISTLNLHRLEGENFPVYEANEESIDRLFNEQPVDIIIHTATLYGRNKETVKQITSANFSLPFYLLDKAIEHKVNTFINTDTVLDRFTSTYALTKKQFADWLFFRQLEIKVINVQLEHFYGPGCPDTNFITAMIKRLKANEPQIDLTKGEPLRNFVYFADVLSAYRLLLKKLDEIPSMFSNFEVSTHELITIKELMVTLKELSHSKTILNFGAIPYRPNELMKSEVDNHALVALGWEPKIAIEEGLKRTVNS